MATSFCGKDGKGKNQSLSSEAGGSDATSRPEARASQRPARTTRSVTRSSGITNESNSGKSGIHDEGKDEKNLRYDPPIIQRLLLSGIDSLDVGLYVDWGLAKVWLAESLFKAKRLAIGSDTFIWTDCKAGDCLVYASTGKRTYRYHLQTPDFHAYLFNTTLQENTPNVFISLGARALWGGVNKAVKKAVDFFENHGVTVKRVQPSRCDIAADFLLTSGIHLEWFLNHMVPGSRKVRPWMNGQRLETLYVGAPKMPITLRLYDKSLKESTNRDSFFPALWKLDKPENVWRVEFQLRRPALRSYEVESMEDLADKLGGIWRDLTGEWISLRALDDSNTSRRSVLPFWSAVQDVGELLGPAVEVERKKPASGRASAQWYINRAAAYLAGYAAAEGIADLENALRGLTYNIRAYWEDDLRDFDDVYATKRIKMGLATEEGGGKDVVPF